MNIEQRLETGDPITNKEIQREVNRNPMKNQLKLVDSGEFGLTGEWKNISREDAIGSTCLCPAQDPKEAEAKQQRLRKVTGGIVLQTLNKRQLTESHFYRITFRDQTYWKKWLAFQLRSNRLVLKDGVFRPGPQWAISLVSMR